MESAFFILAVLACPVGMGLMMWFMGKSMRRSKDERTAGQTASVAELHAEQRRVAAEIESLEATEDGRPAAEASRTADADPRPSRA